MFRVFEDGTNSFDEIYYKKRKEVNAMNNTGLQRSLEEQLENLKRQQSEAERIYRGRMELGLLTRDPDAKNEN